MALWLVCVFCEAVLPSTASAYCDAHRERGEAHEKTIAAIWFRIGHVAATFPILIPAHELTDKLFEGEWSTNQALRKAG